MSRTPRKPPVTRLGRFGRGLWPDRNPLRRASDLIETAMLAVLVVAFAVAAPFAAQRGAAWAHAAAREAQLQQQSSRAQVTAVLLKPAGTMRPGGGPAALDPLTPARWRAPDGRAVTGDLPVPAGTAAGATVRVWVSRDGRLSGQPLQDSQVTGQACLAGSLSVVALAILLAVTGVLGRRALDKRRMAAWDAEWRASGPRWTTRK